MDRLFLIDAYGLIYRAFFALPPLSTSSGIPTNAVFGFVNMLFKLLKEENPKYLAVVLDSPTPTFRHREYKTYKATRPKMPDEFKLQLPFIFKLLEALNIYSLCIEGYEADDVIASITKFYKDKFSELIIVSADKDIMQLINDKVKVMAPVKGISDIVIYDKNKVRAKFGVLPSQIPDLLSLIGDTSDNIPGVAGIGDKTAVKLINTFGSVENIIENLSQIEPKISKNIQSFKEKILFFKKLVKPNICKLDIDILKSCELKEFNKEKLLELLTQLEFKSIIKELKLTKEEKTEYQIIHTQEELNSLAEEIKEKKKFCIRTEVDNNSIISISISIKPYSAYYIPINGLDLEKVLKILGPLLEDKTIKKYAYDIKKEILTYSPFNLNLKSFDFDVMLGSYLLNPQAKHTLEDIALNYLHYPLLSEEENPNTYSCKCVDIISRIKDILLQKLEEEDLKDLYNKIEHPLIEVLAWMERVGVKVDLTLLNSMSNDLKKKLEGVQAKIFQLAGFEFNLNSPKQLSFVLFEKLKLPCQKKTKTGYSTDEEVLQSLSKIHDLPKLLLEYRELTKLKSSYVDALPLLVNKTTGRIHTTYNQTQTATGRLSSSEPNLQNIPVKSNLRKAFIAEEGFVLVSFDYSQIELRILAHLSGDEKLIDIFKKDGDIHSQTAYAIFKAKDEAEAKLYRRQAKTVNFGIIYGMSCYGLAKELEITPQEANKIIQRYFEEFTGVKRYLDDIINQAKKQGFVKTLWGRKRSLPEINSSNRVLREFAKRQALNTPIQGTAADLIKLAMIEIYKRIDKNQARMILQVHDELVFEILEDKVDKTKDIIKECMENIATFSVPLKLNINIGKNWAEI